MKITQLNENEWLAEGAGWFWVRLAIAGGRICAKEHAPGMLARPSSRQFVKQAKKRLDRMLN